MFLYSLIWNVFRTKITEHCTIFSSLNNASKFIWLITNENWSAIKQLGLFNTTCLETRKLSPKRHTCQCTQFRQATPGNSTLDPKGETIHRMYRNHDYFGDGSVHDTWRPLTIHTIWCSFFWKKVVLNLRFLLLVII
jgi:hypothetical protein